MINEVEKPKFIELFASLRFGGESEEANSNLVPNLKIVGSGKGAMALVFKHLIKKGIIKNKLDEILVADWVGHWVYNEITPFAFPSKRFSERTKAIFVYHQYGFPQDMDKILEFAKKHKLVVIEDCAHAINSSYKGRRLGTLGDYSIWSFSKWFFCFALGGVWSKFPDFDDFADKEVSKSPVGIGFLKDFTKFVYEKTRGSKIAFIRNYVRIFQSASYDLYDKALKPSRGGESLLCEKINEEIEMRGRRYSYFLEKTSKLRICDHLEKSGIIPYVIPIKPEESKINKLVEALNNAGFSAGRYLFDLNRNMLSPNFVSVVCIPCYGKISDEQFFNMTDLVISVLEK